MRFSCCASASTRALCPSTEPPSRWGGRAAVCSWCHARAGRAAGWDASAAALARGHTAGLGPQAVGLPLKLLRLSAPPRCATTLAVQGNLLLLAMGLMEGGSLKAALQSEERRESLRWGAWCARCAGAGARCALQAVARCSLLRLATRARRRGVFRNMHLLTCPAVGCLGATPAVCSGRQVAIDVADALAYLHGQNILHSDICAR